MNISLLTFFLKLTFKLRDLFTTMFKNNILFDSVLDALNSVSDIGPYRIIILGGFNYSYHCLKLSSQTSLKWVMYLEEFFYNVMHSGDNSNIPTFCRNDEIYSTIDYIFISSQMRPMLRSTDIH